MFIVYVLYSKAFKKIYIGYTSNLEQRLMSHNKLGKKGFTSKYRPWILVFSEEFESKDGAMTREKALKGGQGREFIWKVIRDKELVSA